MQLRRTRHDDALKEIYSTPETSRRLRHLFKSSFVVVFGDVLNDETSYIIVKVLDDDGIVRDMTTYDVKVGTMLTRKDT